MHGCPFAAKWLDEGLASLLLAQALRSRKMKRAVTLLPSVARCRAPRCRQGPSLCIGTPRDTRARERRTGATPHRTKPRVSQVDPRGIGGSPESFAGSKQSLA